MQQLPLSVKRCSAAQGYTTLSQCRIALFDSGNSLHSVLWTVMSSTSPLPSVLVKASPSALSSSHSHAAAT